MASDVVVKWRIYQGKIGHHKLTPLDVLFSDRKTAIKCCKRLNEGVVSYYQFGTSFYCVRKHYGYNPTTI